MTYLEMYFLLQMINKVAVFSKKKKKVKIMK